MLQTLRRDPLPLLVAVFSALLCACAVAGGGPVQLLGVLPPILLVLALACERYPGEQLIHRLAERHRSRRPRGARRLSPRHRAEPSIPWALLLLATCRKLRGPPVALAF
jgi:hypothetical protein